MRCGKLVQKKGMSEPRPCIRNHQKSVHNGRFCTPDLTGLKIHNYTVLSRADDLIDGTGTHRTQWHVIDDLGRPAIQLAESMFKGAAKGIRAKKKSGLGARTADGKKRPEYQTILSHYIAIFNSKPGSDDYRYYHGIPFCDDWNRHKGGSFMNGMNWILDNLGPRPEGAQLHLVPMNRGGKGFGPWKADDGNWSIRWLSAPENNAAHNKRWVEHCSNEEFEKEANRRGFKLVRISEAAA